MHTLIFIFFVGYTLLLFLFSWLSSRKATNDTYFRGNRKSPWFIVAYGMIGASLSGVTFMSVPGDVRNTQFAYLCVVLGYILGYLVITYVLLPLYYKNNLTSIYQFLGTRFGLTGQKTGSILFIISRLVGSALRMYLVIFVLQLFLFDAWGIPIWLTAIFMIFIIFLYTFRGGIKTVVWTDLLQTTFFITALIITIIIIIKELDFSFADTFATMKQSGYLKVWNTDWRESSYYLKQIIGGMFITISMTGLDQDMMQKNLSCKTLKESQKNMLTFTGILVIVNMLFLFLGSLLLVFAQQKGIDVSAMKSDQIYPHIALNSLGILVAVFFVIGLIAAGYSSADGTFTALTTSFCFDILNIEKWTTSEKQRTIVRRLVHAGMAILFLGIIIIFSNFHNDALIRIIITVAGYTYGPILGLFAFGIFSKRHINKPILIPIFAVLIPCLMFIVSKFSAQLLFGYKFGFELLILNGALMFGALWATSTKGRKEKS